MTSTRADFAIARGRAGFGTWSLIAAAVAFSLGAVSLTVYAALPDDSSEPVKSIATWVFLVGFVGLAPVLHVVGFVLALVAVARRDDSRLRGWLGLLFNSVAVAIVVGLIWLGLQALAAFT